MKTPKLPRADTLTGRALMRLMVGRKFTHRDFQNETASYRLSSSIEQLRNRHGWKIEASEETSPTKDPTGRNATYARYSLEPEFLRNVRAQMGERFDNFIQAVKRFESKEVEVSKPRQAARCSNTKAADIKQLQRHFIEAAKRVKPEFIRVAAWCRLALGG